MDDKLLSIPASSRYCALDIHAPLSCANIPIMLVSLSDQDEEEDEDDPFYMPMAPAAVKFADASKFTTLARPIGTTEASPFMIEMEPGAEQIILQER